VARFRLGELADYMVFSCVVKLRKPDPEIWQLALNLVQVKASECIYIDDRPIFAQFAAELGFVAHHHTSAEQTARFLGGHGLGPE
jgi:putative hydrolase of the HAD superfamily